MKLGINFLTLAVSFGIGLLVMINGWGVQPQSWGWILGGLFCSFVNTVRRKLLGGIKISSHA
jgi:hypothetical protein